ncbi:CPBP family intramembrane glutamic endopeptidase [Micromonosporaceae bacterium Da 78-11]
MTTGRCVGAYVLLAYTVSWICWLPLAFSHRIVHVGGWPTHLPGLLGPAVATVAVTGMVTGRAGARDLLARLTRWRIGWWWLVALSPLVLLGLALAGRAAAGQGPPRWEEFGLINEFPSWGPLTVLVLLIVVNGLGEETGWRGFLQPALQRVLPPRLAILAVAAVWAGWHAPLFAILTTYRGFTPLTLVGFGIGLACGAVVLGWLYNRTGSILAVAVWHATYNVGRRDRRGPRRDRRGVDDRGDDRRGEPDHRGRGHPRPGAGRSPSAQLRTCRHRGCTGPRSRGVGPCRHPCGGGVMRRRVRNGP